MANPLRRTVGIEANPDRETHEDLADQIEYTLDSPGYHAIRHKIAECLDGARNRCETEADPVKLNQAQGEARAYRHVLHRLPQLLIAEHRAPEREA